MPGGPAFRLHHRGLLFDHSPPDVEILSRDDPDCRGGPRPGDHRARPTLLNMDSWAGVERPARSHQNFRAPRNTPPALPPRIGRRQIPPAWHARFLARLPYGSKTSAR